MNKYNVICFFNLEFTSKIISSLSQNTVDLNLHHLVFHKDFIFKKQFFTKKT